MKKAHDFFCNRQFVIASMHGKEKAMVPILEQFPGLRCIVPQDYNTDVFGTFSGEVERKDDPITTLRHKCLLAMDTYQCDLGIASEGSFGPHPSSPFLKADDELVMLIDRQHNLEIVAREISTQTNFDAKEVSTENELSAFARSCMFPSHGLILSDREENPSIIFKGINHWDALMERFREIKSSTSAVYAQTDMRAMHNPTRMQVIQKAAEKLAEKMNALCPQCHTPGYDVMEVRTGLPCNWCGMPTRSTLSHIYGCKKCGYRSVVNFPYSKTTEDPMYCDQCNP